MSFFVVILFGAGFVFLFEKAGDDRLKHFSLLELVLLSLSAGIGMIIMLGLLLDIIINLS